MNTSALNTANNSVNNNYETERLLRSFAKMNPEQRMQTLIYMYGDVLSKLDDDIPASGNEL
jgi:hypothetical protein